MEPGWLGLNMLKSDRKLN